MLLFQPGEAYIPVSITGAWCQLLCEYCRGRWLRGMVYAETPDKLRRLVEKRAHRLTGILISGGFTRDGRLPYKPFLDVLRWVRRRYPHLIISMHTGFVGDRREAEKLTDIVDFVDYEVPLTRSQLKMMRLTWRTVEDYVYDAAMLQDAGLAVAPHILLGLPGASLQEELTSLRLLLRHVKPEVLVVLYYTDAAPDVRGALVELERVAKTAKAYVSSLALGCMRPIWLRRIDYLFLNLFDRIAAPSPRLRTMLRLQPLPYCCAVPLNLLREKLGAALAALGEHRE